MITLKIISRIVQQKNFIISSRTTISGLLTIWNSSKMQSRSKYNQHLGVKGIRGRKFDNLIIENNNNNNETQNINEIDLDDNEYDLVVNSTMNITRKSCDQNVLIIQPYIKWGENKSEINPDLKLQEAEALVRSLPQWNIVLSIKVPLESMKKKTLFGSGKLEELKNLIKSYSSKSPISCVFVSKGTLSFSQKSFLQTEFGLPIMDRYSIVIQILRLHATSAESKLQVAMAEIPYIWGQMKDINISVARKQGYFLNDAQKEMLKKRERKLKHELEHIRSQRKLLRNKRKQKNFPIIAVVGYTNAGKTSLIKSLTNEKSMQPRDQLFATLDVTAHAGLLPCNLEVIYMDTVGFMSDIPTGLIECFIATLEDAMMADLIIHVQDYAHENCLEQIKHVESTLKSLIISTNKDGTFKSPKIINVGNKIDLISNSNSLESNSNDINLVSSKTLVGVDDLVNVIEEAILEETDRKKITIRVKSGGEEMAWLYKNAAVTNSRADPNDEQSILIEVIITSNTMQQFKHYFCGTK